MSSQDQILQELKQIYALEHDRDVLDQIRGLGARIYGYARFNGQDIYQDQLDAIQNIATQYGQTLEDTIGGITVRDYLVTHLQLHSTTDTAKTLVLPGQLTHLTELTCLVNNLTTITIPPSAPLQRLFCSHNSLTALHLPLTTPLQTLSCKANQLHTLQLPHTATLEKLCIGNNKITELAIPPKTPLQHLECQRNQLTTLTIPPNTPLQFLFCSDNNLTTLTIPQNTQLHELRCGRNLLKVLHIPPATPLRTLVCDPNDFLIQVTIPASCKEVWAPPNCQVDYY